MLETIPLLIAFNNNEKGEKGKRHEPVGLQPAFIPSVTYGCFLSIQLDTTRLLNILILESAVYRRDDFSSNAIFVLKYKTEFFSLYVIFVLKDKLIVSLCVINYHSLISHSSRDE